MPFFPNFPSIFWEKELNTQNMPTKKQNQEISLSTTLLFRTQELSLFLETQTKIKNKLPNYD